MTTTVRAATIYEGRDITAVATAAVTERRFLAISGNRSAAGPISVAPATAGGRICGVAGNTAAIGDQVRVVRGASRVVWVDAASNIAAGAEVEVGTAGKAITKDTGAAVGYAITGATSGAPAEISLYH